jgi:DNA-binding NarL/FixJ family response regulator
VIVQGVRKILDDDSRFQVVAEASTFPSFRKKLLAVRPDVVLLDWHLASQDLEVTTALLQAELHGASMIFLTVSGNSPEKRKMLRMGARAFVSKWCSAGKLRSEVSRFCNGAASLETVRAEVLAASSCPGSFVANPGERMKQLTHRERQLVPLVCSGLKNREIAVRLGISQSTVWHHLTAVFTKLQVEDRLGLAAFVYGHRLLSAGPQSRSNLRAVESHQSPSKGFRPTIDFDREPAKIAQS